MKKWRDYNITEKVMVGLILMLLIGIVTRWGYIRKEASDAVGRYFKVDSTMKIDSYDSMRIPGEATRK